MLFYYAIVSCYCILLIFLYDFILTRCYTDVTLYWLIIFCHYIVMHTKTLPSWMKYEINLRTYSESDVTNIKLCTDSYNVLQLNLFHIISSCYRFRFLRAMLIWIYCFLKNSDLNFIWIYCFQLLWFEIYMCIWYINISFML